MELAACCRLLAVCSVRTLRSWLPVAISALAVAMLSVEWRMPPMVRDSVACMSARAFTSWPISSFERTSTRTVRSPAATRCAAPSASFTGTVMLRVMLQAQAPPITSVNKPSAMSKVRLSALLAAISVAAASMLLRWRSSRD